MHLYGCQEKKFLFFLCSPFAIIIWQRIRWKPHLHENPCKPRQKKSIKFTKKITYVDDMMIHNLVIFISHKRSRVWTRYFTRLCIIISSTYVIFLLNLYDFFAVVCTDFHEECVFHPIRCLITLI
jgi:hypothetical protein